VIEEPSIRPVPRADSFGRRLLIHFSVSLTVAPTATAWAKWADAARLAGNTYVLPQLIRPSQGKRR
jgi:hypothetical protein